MTEIICLWNKAWNGILGRNSSLVSPSKDTPKRPPYLALQWHWEDECVDFKYPNTCNTLQYCRIWMIILYHAHFHYRIITPFITFGRLWNCSTIWKTVEIAYLSFKKSKIFWGHARHVPIVLIKSKKVAL